LSLVPQDATQVSPSVSKILSEGALRVSSLLSELGAPTDAASMLDLERKVRACFAGLADQVLAVQLSVTVASPEVHSIAREKAKFDKLGEGVPLANKGRRRVSVQLLGVMLVTVVMSYFAPDRSRCPGRRRASRRKTGSGCYPILDQLGFIERRSPALVSDIARYVCGLSSLAEAREALEIRGVELDKKALHRVAKLLGDRALRCREYRLTAFKNGTLGSTGEFAGKRIAILFDGGRTRTRVSGKRGRRRKKTRRRGYKTPWREPKVFVLYELDERGRRTKTPPIYQGTFAPWAKLFEFAAAECHRRGVTDASEVVIVSDGSNSIWDRVADLITALKIPAERVTKILDFYHAAEHLSDLAKLRTSWSKNERGKWVKRMKKLLKAGRIEELLLKARCSPLAGTPRRSSASSRTSASAQNSCATLSFVRAAFRAAAAPSKAPFVASSTCV